ncbi:MAG: hypothetical protein Q8K60_06235 [Parachlamydiaceae bacterium]|nr:hypothetical protein [Parachlamydiaceae bacterium]
MTDRLNLDLASRSEQLNQNKLKHGVGHQAALLHAQKVAQEKEKIDLKSAEVIQRENKKTFISSIMSELNVLTDELNNLDISEKPELIEKIKVARDELEIPLPELKTKFNSLERDRILQILDLKKQEYDIKNKQDMQNVDAWIKLTYQFLDMTMDLIKNTNRTIGTLTHSFKGS